MSEKPDMSLAGRHARLKEAGLTRYTLAEVEAALAEADAIIAECRLARQRCIDMLNSDPGYQQYRNRPLWESYLETDAAWAAYELLSTHFPCPSFPFAGTAEEYLAGRLKRYSREMFPLSRWRETIGRWRRWAARVRKALE